MRHNILNKEIGATFSMNYYIKVGEWTSIDKNSKLDMNTLED